MPPCGVLATKASAPTGTTNTTSRYAAELSVNAPECAIGGRMLRRAQPKALATRNAAVPPVA